MAAFYTSVLRVYISISKATYRPIAFKPLDSCVRRVYLVLMAHPCVSST